MDDDDGCLSVILIFVCVALVVSVVATAINVSNIARRLERVYPDPVETPESKR